jgi:hypothetical protein
MELTINELGELIRERMDIIEFIEECNITIDDLVERCPDFIEQHREKLIRILYEE